jgi:galactokinase
MIPALTHPHLPADTARFLDRLESGADGLGGARRALFGSGADVYVSRAPGRLDVMGGIADYSGSLVLQWPIQEATHVALSLDAQPRLRVVSLVDGEVRECEVPLDVLAPGGRPATYEDARRWFGQDSSRQWAAYAAGAWVVLARERQVSLTGGASVLVHSDVPEGRGVSSSAALEAAVMRSLAEALGTRLSIRDTALLCQRVENLVVGAPCGVMDQMAVVGGEAGRFMALLCQPAEFLGTVALPEGLALWGIDSGIKHAVSGADYTSVRVGAFMGYRILADLVGLPAREGDRPGHVRIDDRRWGGYLVNVGVETFETLASQLPMEITGAEFLARYGGTTDTVTTIDPQRSYAVRVPARHPVYEHARVTQWHTILRALEADKHAPLHERAVALGALMYESHESYSACRLGSDGTDRLVELARAAGVSKGVYGAKITGGGSGGTVALLTSDAAGPLVRDIADRYAAETNRAVRLFSGSSPGAAAFGALHVRFPSASERQP